MSNIEAIRAAIAQAVSKASDASSGLNQVAENAEDAQQLMNTVTQGSVQGDVETVNALFEKVKSVASELQSYLQQAISGAEGINSRL